MNDEIVVAQRSPEIGISIRELIEDLKNEDRAGRWWIPDCGGWVRATVDEGIGKPGLPVRFRPSRGLVLVGLVPDNNGIPNCARLAIWHSAVFGSDLATNLARLLSDPATVLACQGS